MNICAIGAGYVGLVTGAGLAKLGHNVTVVEIDEDKVGCINNGRAPAYEEGLEELLHSYPIRATCDVFEAIDSEIIFICVGTPSNSNGEVSLNQVEQATEGVSKLLKQKENYCVVCVKSTMPPGTTEELIIPILQKSGKKVGVDFGVCMNPEFLAEGKAINDFLYPARIVIGEYDKHSGDKLAELYHNFDAPIVRTNLRTAEMIKLASNAFLATKISFIGEIGNICKKLGIDVYEVARGMSLDERIGNKFLNAGIGFGGSCLPKDLKGLISKSKELNYNPGLLKEVLSLNDKQPLLVVALLKRHVLLKGATIGVLGLSFKPGTDDIRDSRAIEVVRELLSEGAVVKAYDPLAVKNFQKLFPHLAYVTKEEVLNCDAVVILTEWSEFSELDYSGKIVIDGRRIKKAQKEARLYEGICW